LDQSREKYKQLSEKAEQLEQLLQREKTEKKTIESELIKNESGSEKLKANLDSERQKHRSDLSRVDSEKENLLHQVKQLQDEKDGLSLQVRQLQDVINSTKETQPGRSSLSTPFKDDEEMSPVSTQPGAKTESKDENLAGEQRKITPRGKTGRRVSEIQRANFARRKISLQQAGLPTDIGDDLYEEDDDKEVNSREDNNKEHTSEQEPEEAIPTAEEIKKKTIQELKSWLTKRDIVFSQSKEPKQYYIDLLAASFGLVSVQATKTKRTKT